MAEQEDKYKIQPISFDGGIMKREIKRIQFVGASPIILGEARTMITPDMKGIDQISLDADFHSECRFLNILLSSGDLQVIPIQVAVITYGMMQQELPLFSKEAPLKEPSPVKSAASKKKT